MKRQKGITLIALIITIIVMLILVGVTVNVAINGGLIDVTREAKFKTEVRQIQEALQVKKVTLAATNGGELPETVSITLDNLDMEQELKDNFGTKLTIDKSEDDLVLRYTSNVTAQEEQWLIELGIGSGTGTGTGAGGDFVTDVTAFVGDNFDEEYGYNYYEIYNYIKTKYLPATILTDDGNGGLIPANIVYSLSEAIDKQQQTVLMLEEKYQNPESVTITSEIETEIRERLGTINTYNVRYFFDNSTTVADVITKINAKLEQDNFNDQAMNYVVINGEDRLLISSSGVSNYTLNDETIIITEAEASKFEYNYVEENLISGPLEIGKINIGEITGYKENEKIIEFPGIIIKENGDPIFVQIIKANALATTKPVKLNAVTDILEPLMLEPNLGKTYSQVSIAELKAVVSSLGVTPGAESYEETIEGKNRFLMKYVLPLFCAQNSTAEQCIETIGEGEEQQLYGYVTFSSTSFYETTPTFYPIPTDSNGYVEGRDKVVISEGIMGIEDSILSGNVVKDLYLPKTLSASDTSTTALSGIRITKIRTRLTYDEITEINDTDRPAEKILGSRFGAGHLEYITD